jgi:hypothetical protein
MDKLTPRSASGNVAPYRKLVPISSIAPDRGHPGRVSSSDKRHAGSCGTFVSSSTLSNEVRATLTLLQMKPKNIRKYGRIKEYVSANADMVGDRVSFWTTIIDAQIILKATDTTYELIRLQFTWVHHTTTTVNIHGRRPSA